MEITVICQKTKLADTTEWVRRRSRLPKPLAAIVAELAFATRVAHLGDRGDTLASVWQEGGR